MQFCCFSSPSFWLQPVFINQIGCGLWEKRQHTASWCLLYHCCRGKINSNGACKGFIYENFLFVLNKNGNAVTWCDSYSILSFSEWLLWCLFTSGLLFLLTMLRIVVLVTLTWFGLVDMLNAGDSAELCECSSAALGCSLCLPLHNLQDLLRLLQRLLKKKIPSQIEPDQNIIYIVLWNLTWFLVF